MTREEKCKDFLDKLQTLCDENGIYIKPYRDQYYNPTIEINEDGEIFYLEFDEESKVYVVRKGDPYDGDQIK